MRDSKTVLIAGFGDVGERTARLLRGRYRVVALVRKADQARKARRLGLHVVRADLDQPRTLKSLALLGRFPGLRVCHFAPPPSAGPFDTRTRNLVAALWPAGARRGKPVRHHTSCQRLAYISTSGVYGDCRGAWVDESRPLRPQTARAARRADAERVLLQLAKRTGVRVSVLRAPGIVSETRLPLERLRRGTPALVAADDVYVNHIHAQDLARAAVAALRHARRGRIFNCVDDAPQLMGEYFDRVAARAGLPAPPRISREEAQRALPPLLYSFMDESRRLSNARMKRELKFALRFPDIDVLLDRAFGKPGV